jgi:hypothetical protein
MFGDIGSYFVRRAVCGLTPKNYNKTFLQLLKKLAPRNITVAALHSALSSLEGDASRWPRDDEFRRSWLSGELYPGRLDAVRTKALLEELEGGMRSIRTEEPFYSGSATLDIDHILPTSWFEFWPLRDGTKANKSEADSALLADITGTQLTEQQAEIRRREQRKMTIGNLTLLHYGVNRSLQHREFSLKREALFRESNLHLNRPLMLTETWDEESILHRSETLFQFALQNWPGPSTP